MNAAARGIRDKPARDGGLHLAGIHVARCAEARIDRVARALSTASPCHRPEHINALTITLGRDRRYVAKNTVGDVGRSRRARTAVTDRGYKVEPDVLIGLRTSSDGAVEITPA